MKMTHSSAMPAITNGPPPVSASIPTTPLSASLTPPASTEVPQVRVADAGYWHQQQMERIVDRGIPVLIPPDAKSRKGTRPGWDGGVYAFMRSVLASDRGGEFYGPRQAIIEPVFAKTSSTAASTASDAEDAPPFAPSGG
jgi:hypothetical protein